MKGAHVDITVYLPDEIGTRAKEAELPFSRMLRDAVEEELDRRATIADTLAEGVQEHEVDLETHTGVITGKLLGTFKDGDQIFLTNDERVLVYQAERMDYYEMEDPEAELADLLQQTREPDTSIIADVMRALGFRPRVRL